MYCLICKHYKISCCHCVVKVTAPLLQNGCYTLLGFLNG